MMTLVLNVSKIYTTRSRIFLMGSQQKAIKIRQKLPLNNAYLKKFRKQKNKYSLIQQAIHLFNNLKYHFDQTPQITYCNDIYKKL